MAAHHISLEYQQRSLPEKGRLFVLDNDVRKDGVENNITKTTSVTSSGGSYYWW